MSCDVKTARNVKSAVFQVQVPRVLGNEEQEYGEAALDAGQTMEAVDRWKLGVRGIKI